jgi:hypothetical protein
LFCLYIVVLSISRPARIYHPQDNKFRDGKGNVNTRANDIGFFKAEVKESDKQRYRPRPSTFGGSLKRAIVASPMPAKTFLICWLFIVRTLFDV